MATPSNFLERCMVALKAPTASAVARALDLTPASVGAWANESLPKKETLLKISQLSGFSLHWLLTGEGPQRIQADEGVALTNTEGQIDKSLARLTPYAKIIPFDTPPENTLIADLHSRVIDKIRREAAKAGKPIEDFAADLVFDGLLKRGIYTDQNVGGFSFRIIDFDEEFVPIPVWGKIAAGKPLFINQHSDEWVHVPVEYRRRFGNKVFALIIDGDSMNGDGIFDGDIIVCVNTVDIPEGKMVVAVIDGDCAAMKRWFKRKGMIVLESSNPRYGEQKYEPERVEIKGLVVGMHRSF